MPLGLFTAFLRLIGAGRYRHAGPRPAGRDLADGRDAAALDRHQRTDLGLADGRISPSTVNRSPRSSAWDMIERPPRSL
ncbi:hypothetical protein [Neorhizobium sp. NCHU2750]|uniref:hypothetical protein n=1 Tax=Neorhizobium sp. NCHU2750 TaxID=1825976 RepID=UPI000EB63AD7|nr:hypothetical protein NCHU2750_24670 [Neorhizobium sp. NCHU2750]